VTINWKRERHKSICTMVFAIWSIILFLTHSQLVDLHGLHLGKMEGGARKHK
jgi:hypothetical protein